MLPKIHKKKFPVPGRPIVSSCDSPTEKISMLLDIILQPLVLQTESYIRDTGDLMKVSNALKNYLILNVRILCLVMTILLRC